MEEFILKHRTEIPQVEELVSDPDKALKYLTNVCMENGNLLELAEWQRMKPLLGTRSSVVDISPFKSVQRCVIPEAIDSADTYVTASAVASFSDTDTAQLYLPMEAAFQQLYSMSAPEEDQENALESNAAKTTFRLLSLDPASKVLSVAACDSLRKPLDGGDIQIGVHAPRVFYEGQLLQVTEKSIESGPIQSKHLTLRDMPSWRFEGNCRFLCVSLPSNAIASNVADVLLALNGLCETLSSAHVICFVNCNPSLQRWSHLKAEWDLRHQNKCTIHFLGVPTVSDSPWDMQFFKRELVLRFQVEGQTMPFVFTNLPILQYLACRSIGQSNVLDGLVEDLMKNRHLLPSLWMSATPPSLHPMEADKLGLDPTTDFVVVCPSDERDILSPIGKHGLHCAIVVPYLAVCKITFFGMPNLKRNLPVWKRIDVDMANLESTPNITTERKL